MDRSKITADHVAEDIYRAVEEGEFWVLPHAMERRLWYVKRYTPPLFNWLMSHESKRWMKKFGAKQAA